MQVKHAQKCKKSFDLLSISYTVWRNSKEALLVSVLAAVSCCIGMVWVNLEI